MHENRPELSGSDAFMAEFARGAGLLPVPAAFAEDDRLSDKAGSEFIAGLLESVRVRNRKMAVLGAAAVIAASVAAAILLSFVPDSWFGFLDRLPDRYISHVTARYLLTGFFAMSLAALAGSKIYSRFSQIVPCAAMMPKTSGRTLPERI